MREEDTPSVAGSACLVAITMILITARMTSRVMGVDPQS
jgi:hypothetical protein